MAIFKMVGLDGYELAQFRDRATRELLNRGGPFSNRWPRPEIEVVHEDAGKRLRHSDAPWVGLDPPVFRPRAVEALGELLSLNGELLPLSCETELWLFNATKVVDALDEQRSEIWRFPDGSFMRAHRHVFHPGLIADLDVFRHATKPAAETFFSSRFVAAWTGAGLRGAEFIEVWPENQHTANRTTRASKMP